MPNSPNQPILTPASTMASLNNEIRVAALPATRIYDAYMKTPYGAYAAETPRYERMKPSVMTVRNWALLGGENMSLALHAGRSLDVARNYVAGVLQMAPDTFSMQTVGDILAAQVIHDHGETAFLPNGKRAGDHPWIRKTVGDEWAEETAHRRAVPEFTTGLGPEDIASYERALDIVYSDKTSGVGLHHNAIEMVNFLGDIIHNFTRSVILRELGESGKTDTFQPALRHMGIHDPDQIPSAITAVDRLWSEALGSGVLEQLLNASRTIPYVGAVLLQHSGIISDGFTMGLDRVDVFDWYDTEDPGATPGEKERRLAKFYMQKHLWREWVLTQSLEDIPLITRKRDDSF